MQKDLSIITIYKQIFIIKIIRLKRKPTNWEILQILIRLSLHTASSFVRHRIKNTEPSCNIKQFQNQTKSRLYPSVGAQYQLKDRS